MPATAEPTIEARRAEWTPGPWRAAALLTGSLDDPPSSYLIERTNGLHIAEVPAGFSANRNERGTHRANARLIAASPDLLAALIALRDAVKASGKLNGREYVDLGIQVTAAIAKAEGE